MDKVPFVSQNPCSNFIYLVYVSNSIVKKYDNRVKKTLRTITTSVTFTRKHWLFSKWFHFSTKNNHICMSTCYYEQPLFVSGVTSRCAGTRGMFWNSVPGNTKCHPSILNSREMGPKPGLMVHIKERSLTILGSAGKFWGEDAIFWAPILEGQKFSEPAWGEGYIFGGTFGRCART